MAWLAERWANIVHPTDNHTPTMRLNANIGPTLSCYLEKRKGPKNRGPFCFNGTTETNETKRDPMLNPTCP